MNAISTQGVAAPGELVRDYGKFGASCPGLRGFRLTWDRGVDREIGLIQVLPGGRAADLSGSADLQPSDVPDGCVEVGLQDGSPGASEKFGYEVSHSLMTVPGARRYQVRTVGCVGETVRDLRADIFGVGPHGSFPIAPPVIAIVGFKLFFTGARDRRIDRVGVWFREADLHVVLADKDPGRRDVYGYLVDFVVIPAERMRVHREWRFGRATAFDTVPHDAPAGAEPVITGWHFGFRAGDHELSDIGVQVGSSQLSVFYGDSGGGDEFAWSVELAHLAPMIVGRALPTFSMLDTVQPVLQ